MKKIKQAISLLLIGVLILTLNSCSGCDNENPRARVTNYGSDKVSVQIKTSGGNTENINNIDPNKSSEYTSYNPGEVTFTIVVKDGKEFTKTVSMEHCIDYDITIDKNNIINTNYESRN